MSVEFQSRQIQAKKPSCGPKSRNPDQSGGTRCDRTVEKAEMNSSSRIEVPWVNNTVGIFPIIDNYLLIMINNYLLIVINNYLLIIINNYLLIVINN